MTVPLQLPTYFYAFILDHSNVELIFGLCFKSIGHTHISGISCQVEPFKNQFCHSQEVASTAESCFQVPSSKSVRQMVRFMA